MSKKSKKIKRRWWDHLIRRRKAEQQQIQGFTCDRCRRPSSVLYSSDKVNDQALCAACFLGACGQIQGVV